MKEKKKRKLKHNTKLKALFLISTLFSYLVGTYVFDNTLIDFTKTLDSILLFVSISVGFIGTSLSIFATVSDQKLGVRLKKSTNSKKQFINTLSNSIFTGLLIILITIIYQLLNSNSHNHILLISINYLWLFLIPIFIGYGYLIVSIILTFLFSDES